jgi:sugar phosphate isomerase/epimerase
LKISALTSSLPMPLLDAIQQIADLGFEWIDVPPVALDSDATQLVRENNLQVGCVALEKGHQEHLDLASDDTELRTHSIALFSRAIQYAAEIQSPVCYLTPPTATDIGTRDRWTDSIIELANEAQSNGIKLCIEHFPNRLLATAQITLDYIEELKHSALALLVDVGHCLISREDPATVIASAGDRLGYIHFDDNDGISDLHWPLLTGELREDQLRSAMQVACEVGYQGALCLELNPGNNEPALSLNEGKSILERLKPGK